MVTRILHHVLASAGPTLVILLYFSPGALALTMSQAGQSIFHRSTAVLDLCNVQHTGGGRGLGLRSALAGILEEGQLNSAFKIAVLIRLFSTSHVFFPSASI